MAIIYKRWFAIMLLYWTLVLPFGLWTVVTRNYYLSELYEFWSILGWAILCAIMVSLSEVRPVVRNWLRKDWI